MSKNWRDDYVRQVRAIGESLIKNAESIVGKEEFGCGLDIKVTIGPNSGIPLISVTRHFYPEKSIEELKEL